MITYYLIVVYLWYKTIVTMTVSVYIMIVSWKYYLLFRDKRTTILTDFIIDCT